MNLDFRDVAFRSPLNVSHICHTDLSTYRSSGTTIEGNQIVMTSHIRNFLEVHLYFFSFPGNESGTWYVDLKTGPAGSCGTGNPAVKPDVTMSMNDEVFQQMFSGEILMFFLNLLVNSED